MSGDRRDASEIYRRLAAEWEAFPGVTLNEARGSVGLGWQRLGEEAWRTIDEASCRIRQIKEKFGSLRVYYDRVDAEVEAAVRQRIGALEQESRRVCEWCGAPGELRDEEYAAALSPQAELRSCWFKTLCDHPRMGVVRRSPAVVDSTRLAGGPRR